MIIYKSVVDLAASILININLATGSLKETQHTKVIMLTTDYGITIGVSGSQVQATTLI